MFPCPRSRLRIWPRETGLAISSRVSVIIINPQAQYLSIYLYIYIYIYGHLLYQSMDQQSEITNPACGQLNRENECLPFPVRAREFGPARQVWRSHPAPACPFSTLRLNPVLTHGIPPAFHSRHRISPETPSPQEGLRVLRRCYEEHIIIDVACRRDIRRRR